MEQSKKPITYSRTLTHGCLVQLKSNKIIRTSRRTKKPLGVFQIERPIVMLMPQNGELNRWTVTIPQGVQVKGACEIQTFKETKK